MQERIAAYFGLTLGEMLRIGENLIHGKVVFPWSDQLDGMTRKQQILRIAELTNHQVGHPQDNLKMIEDMCDFLEGSLTPADFYQSYLKTVRSRTA